MKTLHLMWYGGGSVAGELYRTIVCLGSCWPWTMIGGHRSVAPADIQARQCFVPIKSQLYIRASMGQTAQLPFSFENDALAMVKESCED